MKIKENYQLQFHYYTTTNCIIDDHSSEIDPEVHRFMSSIIHKTFKKGKKSSVIMNTHSLDEGETLYKRMNIMVDGNLSVLERPA